MLRYARVRGAAQAGHATLACLRQARGDTAGVARALAGLTRAGAAGETYAGAVAAACSLYAASGRPPVSALAWARDCAAATEDAPFGVNAWGEARYRAFLTWSHVAVAAGDGSLPGGLPGLLALVARRLAEAQQGGLLPRAIELTLVQALALHALGENRQAFEALRWALSAAEPEGYVRIFTAAPGLDRLLAEAVGRGIGGEYARGLLAVLGAAGSVAQEATPPAATAALVAAAEALPADGLTEREQEVLALAAAGLSNAEIAARLYIEISTVKRHMNHILGKLEAGNRVQAIARARALGLLA